jgi:uncharacterized protein (DUF849 family)
MAPILITCAVTGSIHTPSMSPYLPWRPQDIADQAVDAARAGAAILHLHPRDPVDGRPSAEPDHFMAILPDIARRCDAVLNLSTGGSAVMALETRLAGPMRAAPEMCSLNMGTMNFALYPMADRWTDWQFDWEEPFLRGSDDLVFKNTPRDIAHVLAEMGEKRGARFEFECYDSGHLTMLRHFLDRGLVAPPLFLQFVFGVLGGMAAEPENLTHMKRLADRYFGEDYMFSVLAAGRRNCRWQAWPPRWGAMCASGWRTTSISTRASSPGRTPSRWRAFARSSRRWGAASPARPRRARCWG